VMCNPTSLFPGTVFRWDWWDRWYCRRYCRLLVVLIGGTGGTTIVAFRAISTALRTPVPLGSTACSHHNPV
jgi:hypothetical protein